MTVREYLALQDDGCPNCTEHLIGDKRIRVGRWSVHVSTDETDRSIQPRLVVSGFGGFVMFGQLLSPNEIPHD